MKQLSIGKYPCEYKSVLSWLIPRVRSNIIQICSAEIIHIHSCWLDTREDTYLPVISSDSWVWSSTLLLILSGRYGETFCYSAEYVKHVYASVTLTLTYQSWSSCRSHQPTTSKSKHEWLSATLHMLSCKQICARPLKYTAVLTCPRKKMPPPTMKAEMAVPITAKSVMDPMFWKKLPWTYKDTQLKYSWV